MNFKKTDEKDKHKNTSRKKILFLGITFEILLLFFLFKIYYIKDVHGEEYERIAVNQTASREQNETLITASRGVIYDRDQKSLAVSYPVDNIVIDIRGLVKQGVLDEENKLKEQETTVLKDTVQHLSLFLNIPEEEIYALLETDEDGVPKKNKSYYILAKEVDKEVSKALMESGVKHVSTQETSKRIYVHEGLASQVLGFLTGGDNWGLEGSYNKELSGKDGKIVSSYSGDELESTFEDEVQNGYTLITTLDTTIQGFAEDVVKETGEEFEANNTAAIVMNPKTGEVLAMAQYPGFNSSDPRNLDYITSTSYKEYAKGATDEELSDVYYNLWVNYNTSRSFEFGSIFKPMVVAGALEEGIISSNSSYFCDGGEDFYGQYVGCWTSKTGGHGKQSLTEVLQNSCNDGMFEIAKKMGSSVFYKYQKDFGGGEKTGIDLPGEADFASKSVSYTEADLKIPIQLATSSMGQGFNGTPIQALIAFSATINGGNLMKPYVVSQIMDSNGNIVKENTPYIQKKVISEEVSSFMRQTLKSVVSQNGTGKNAMIPGYSIGGKTGTAQQGVRTEDEEEQDYAYSFVSYFPAEDPEIAMICIIYKEKGSKHVKKVSPLEMSRKLMLNIIKYKGMQPTGDTSEIGSIILEDGDRTLENLEGMDIPSATRYLNDKHFDYEIIGKGYIVESHTPKAETVLAANSKVYLYVKNDESATDLITVPKVTDISANSAVEILSSLGLTPTIENDKNESLSLLDLKNEETELEETEETESEETNNKDSYKTKTVYMQMPSPEATVPRNTEIKLKVRD